MARRVPRRPRDRLPAVLALTATLLAASAAAPPARAGASALPKVASINLCADQLVLNLADDAQILSLSWLASDPAESVLAESAARFAPNYGTAEELLRFAPDVVIAGSLTNDYTRRLLARLGHEVVAIDPADSIDEIERNIERVAAAVGHPERGEALIATLRARVRALRAGRPTSPPTAVLVRPGGFTVGKRSLAHELMTLAGLENVAAQRGLDRWGSLSMETLLRSDPELLILARYRPGVPSLANAVLEHPALASLAARVKTVTVASAYFSCGLPQSLDTVARVQRALGASARR